jgi:hypothetical protein
MPTMHPDLPPNTWRMKLTGALIIVLGFALAFWLAALALTS